MGFEDVLRVKISAAPFKSRERTIYKTLLGEIQQLTAKGKVTDEACFGIVKTIIKENKGNIELLSTDSPKRQEFEEENRILQDLLPAYLTPEQVFTELAVVAGDIKTAKSDGQAIGLAMRTLKDAGKPVEGDTVKVVVESMRKAE